MLTSLLARLTGRGIAALAIVGLLACGQSVQTVALTAEDFRFVPDVVRVSAASPLKLSVYNAGREAHEFDSPLLMYARLSHAPPKGQAGSTGILLAPGQSLEATAAPPPGTYLYICRRKGHGNMTGTLIVE